MASEPLGEAKLIDRAVGAVSSFVLWFCFVTLLGALPLVLPEVWRWAVTGRLDPTKVFPGGELLGPAYAISAAALAQWLGRRGRQTFGGLAKFLIALNIALAVLILSFLWVYWVHANGLVGELDRQWRTADVAAATLWILVAV